MLDRTDDTGPTRQHELDLNDANLAEPLPTAGGNFQVDDLLLALDHDLSQVCKLPIVRYNNSTYSD